MPCQAKAYEPARILEVMLLMHCRRRYIGLAQHLSKFDLQTLHVYKYMGKKYTAYISILCHKLM